MAYNHFQPLNQSQAHTLQHNTYPPSAPSTPTSPVGYSMPPGQSYDPRWYQRPPQQPSGFQYTNQQILPRSSHPQQRIDPPPQSQPFRPMPNSPPVQSGFSISSARPQVQNSYYTLLPAAANPASPLPPSSFHFPGPTTPRQVQHNVPSLPSTSPPNCSPRPLPTPKPRPESLPPPPRHLPQLQAPAPSRPAILTHSPSFASVDPPSSLSSPSSTTSSNGARRPLPTPQRYAKHTSLDLRARPSSPVKISIAEQLLPSLSRLPSKPSMRDVSGSDKKSDGNLSPTTSTQISTRSTAGDNKVSGLSSPTKFVPLWKRELQTSPSPVGNNAPAMERRSTVSGQSAPKVDAVRGSDTSDSIRRDRVQTSPTRRPLPLPQKDALPSSRGLAHTSTAPSMYTQAPASSLTGQENYLDADTEEPMVFADPEDGARTPSPQYGIRDLPQRSRTVIANRGNVADSVQLNDRPTSKDVGQRIRPVRSATLPHPPPSFPPQNPRVPVTSDTLSLINNRSGGGQSLTFRLAAMGLSEEFSTSPTRQLPDSRFPENVPPPPRFPTAQSHPPKTPSVTNVNPVGPSRPAVTQNPPLPEKSLPSPRKDTYGAGFHQMSERQREKQPEFVDLDDAPPPSLRRSPSPMRPSSDNLRSIQISGSPPRRQWTPSKSSSAESPNRSDLRSRPADIPVISVSDNSGNGTITPSISVSAPAAPSISVSSSDLPSISFSPPQISISDPTSDTQSPRGSFGSKHTQVQETQGSKRTLPPLPQRTGLFCGGCGGSIVGRIVSAMGTRWHPGCFRCTICNELLEHVSSYEHGGKPYCHLDYHEVRTFPLCHFSRLNNSGIRNSPLDASTAKPLSSTSGSLLSMIQHLGSGCTTNNISFALSVEIHSSHPLGTRRVRASSVLMGMASSRTTMSALRCIKATLTAKSAT